MGAGGANGVGGKSSSDVTAAWRGGRYTGDNKHLASAPTFDSPSPMPDTMSGMRLDPTDGSVVFPGDPDYPFSLKI